MGIGHVEGMYHAKGVTRMCSFLTADTDAKN